MSLYRRPNRPHWWVRFQLDGREVRLSSGTEDRRAAEEFETVARSRAWRQVRLGERPPYSWKDARRRWLAETTKRSKWRDESILTWFDEHLKDSHLHEITREVVEELRQLKAEEQSPSTADRHMALLRAILKKAVDDWQVIDSAPKVPMFRAAVPEPKWLRPEQAKALLAELPEHLELAARFALETGLRMRSQTALTWDRVDMKARIAWIPAAGMKAGRTHRVPLSDEAVRILKLARKASPKSAHVFTFEGQPVADFNTAAFQKAVTRAEVGPLRWHDLRHTWASWHVQAGTSLHELMELGGWRSYQMVLRYAHLAPDHLAEAANRLALVRTKTGTRRKAGKRAA